MWSKNNNSIVFNGGIIMSRKFIFLISFVLVLSLAGNAFAFTYAYWYMNDSNSYQDGRWDRPYVDPNYNWQNLRDGFGAPPRGPSGPPETVVLPDLVNNIWLTGEPNTRVRDVCIPAGYDADCAAKAGDQYQTVQGPEWGLKLNIYGSLSFRWAEAVVQGLPGLADGNFPDNDPNRSVVNMYGNSEIYGPWLTGGTTGGNRCEAICLGLSWWFALPYVTWNMYDNSVVYTDALIIGGHLNMYGGTFDIRDYVNVGVRDTFVVPDNLVRMDIYGGKLILPNDTTYLTAAQDWIDRHSYSLRRSGQNHP
jgi:hypothetical protein